MNIKKITSRKFREKMMYALKWMPDAPYVRLFYLFATGKVLHLKHPITFNDKENWLKLYDRHDEYSILADKVKVKEHINSILGEGHVFPLLGAWKSFDDIDFSQLPQRFVIKCNHDSGSIKIINNKNELTDADISEMRDFYTKRLKHNFFYAGREYPYKGVEPCIMAEQFMFDDSHPDTSVEDYKWFCFNGEPKLVYTVSDRSTDARNDFFDMEFNHLDITNIHPQSDKPIAKPAHFEEMKDICRKLTKGMKFVRLDLYEINGVVYFGEYTFYHGGGFSLIKPDEWERKLGDWINLDQ